MPFARVGWGTAYRIATQIANNRRVIRPRDFPDGVTHTWLYHFSGLLLDQVGRGLYVMPGDEPDPLIIVGRKYPRLTVGLTTALWMRGVLANRPANDWWVMGHRDRYPTFAGVNARFLRSRASQQDREEVSFDETWMQAQSLVRAVLDCVRFRRELGEGVAVEALRTALSSGAVAIETLLCRAKELHVHAPLRAMLAEVAPPSL